MRINLPMEGWESNPPGGIGDFFQTCRITLNCPFCKSAANSLGVYMLTPYEEPIAHEPWSFFLCDQCKVQGSAKHESENEINNIDFAVPARVRLSLNLDS